jgi:hypothetical protein
VVPALYITEPIPPLKELQKENATSFSTDFDRAWYIQVGTKITITMMIAIFSPHVINFVSTPLRRWLRKRGARKAILQKDMNSLSVGPSFEFT